MQHARSFRSKGIKKNYIMNNSICTKITLATICKILQPLDDLDDVEQVRARNGNGCKEVFLMETINVEIIATAIVDIETNEVEPGYYEDQLKFSSVLKLAETSMRAIRRKKKAGAKIAQIEFSIMAQKELMNFHTAEIQNKLAQRIKK